MMNQDSSVNNISTPETVVGESLKVEGELSSKGDLRIDGKVNGSISTEGSIVVGKNAEITADIKAANAEISGRVNGNLTVSNKTSLKSSAKLEGHISTGALSVEDGAEFNGECTMSSKQNTNQPDNSETLEDGYQIETPDHLIAEKQVVEEKVIS